jgi:hypothetical protein
LTLAGPVATLNGGRAPDLSKRQDRINSPVVTDNERRRSERLHIAVAVRLLGIDGDGEAFDFEAWTLDINPTGAAIQVPSEFAVPQRLHVRSDNYQFRADADVMVVWERAQPTRIIGVRIAPLTPATAWQAT